MGRISIRRGDLVNLHRRKTPGLGIVLEREAHTLQKLETEGVYSLFMEMYVDAPNWRAKKKACDYLIRESELNNDLVYAFLIRFGHLSIRSRILLLSGLSLNGVSRGGFSHGYRSSDRGRTLYVF
mgnify:CR=1 FL=1